MLIGEFLVVANFHAWWLVPTTADHCGHIPGIYVRKTCQLDPKIINIYILVQAMYLQLTSNKQVTTALVRAGRNSTQ